MTLGLNFEKQLGGGHVKKKGDGLVGRWNIMFKGTEMWYNTLYLNSYM